MTREGTYFIRQRLGRNECPWGVYQRLGGQGILVSAFRTKIHAAYFAAAKSITTAPHQSERAA